MSQTTEFNYVYRTMKMVEHMGSLRGFEYGPDGEPTYMIGPPPVLPGPVVLLHTTAADFTYGFPDERVTKLQKQLNEEHDAGLTVDGWYGDQTAAAHQAAQRQEASTPTPQVQHVSGRRAGKTAASMISRQIDHAFEPGHFSPDKCQVKLSRGLCPFDKKQHKIDHEFFGLTADGDYCAVAVDDDFCGHKQSEHVTRAKVQTARDALDTAKRQVEEMEKAATKPKYTPNCFACGVAGFFANIPVRSASHGTACQYYEVVPDRPTVEEPTPEPVEVAPREAGKSEEKTPLELGYEKDLQLARRALASAKSLKVASPGLADLMRELGDALEHHAKQAPEHYKEVEKENLRLQNSLLKMVEVLRNRDKTNLWKTIRFGRILRKLGYLPELDA